MPPEDQKEAVGRMLWQRVVKLVLLLCAMLWVAMPLRLLASAYRGQVVFGGLPVPGTTVTVTATATQGEQKVVAISDDQGIFSFPDLADGKWSIDIEMTGFAPLRQEITVALNAPAATFEMKLLTLDQIRAAAKPLKEAPAPVVAATAPIPEVPAAKGAAAKGDQAKAAAPAGPPPPAPDSGSDQANDGLLINGSVNNAATSQYALSQAFGNNRNGKGLYNGGVMLLLDNSALDAKQYSISGLDSPKPAYNNITVGLNFGGPLKIPHLLPLARAPYLFLFYQRLQSGKDTAQAALVPTLAERAGNLSDLSQTIYAPSTGLSPACLAAGAKPGAAFAGNIIPAACISGSAQSLLSFYPAPNVTGSSRDNFQVPTTLSTRQDTFQTSVNKGFGNKSYVNGRFSLQSTRTGSTSLFGFHDANASLGMNTYANWYHRFTQRLSGSLMYQYSRSRTHMTPFFANRQNVEGVAGIGGVDQDPNYWGPPALSFSQSQIYGLTDGISSNNRNQTNGISTNFEWNRFRHNIQAGGDFNRKEFNVLTQSNPRGTFSFTGAATSGGALTAGSDLADLLLGIPDTSQLTYGNPDKYLRESVYDLYATDDFRVNPELSVSAGVRWEYSAPVTETKDRLVNLDIAPGFTAEQPVLASNPKGALTGQTYPTSLVRPDKGMVEPRVGIAWRPISGSSLLVRAGYGVYQDTSVYQAIAMQMATQAPLSTSLNLNNTACSLTLSQAFPACPSITAENFGVDPNFRIGYAQEWKLSAQRDLPGSLQVIGTYLGIKGTRGVQQFLPNTYPAGGANPCPSCPSGFLYRTSNGNSTREAGTIQLRRRLRSGFTANISYTFAKALDDDYSLGGQGAPTTGTITQGGTLSGQIAQDWRNPQSQRGLSTFDQRHVLAVQAQYTTGMGLGGKTLLGGWRGVLYKEWTIATSISAASGLPQTPVDPVAVPGSGYAGIVRANYAGGPIRESTAPGVFLNPNAFTVPGAGQWGNARRDSIPGPNQFSLDATMDRTFRLHDRINLEARLAATNVLNHVTYTTWYTTVSALTSSNSTSPNLFGTPAGANAMRSMQVTLRLRY